MNFNLQRIAKPFGSISLQAENQAERYQLKAVIAEAKRLGIHCEEWDNMEGKSGLCLRLVLDEKEDNQP